MSTGQSTEILLGCDPQVRLVIIEDEGSLVIQCFAEDPSAVDMDALFFNLTDDSVATNINIYPVVNDGQNITGFDVATGQLSYMDNGVQIEDTYDVRVQFGDFPDTSWGDTDEAAFTLWVEGDAPLTTDSIDLTNFTCVINSDPNGLPGVALTGGIGGERGAVYETNIVQADDFDGLRYAYQSDIVASGGRWLAQNGELMAHGCSDGYIYFDQVAVESDTTISFDARVPHTQNFEVGGYSGDSFEVWALVNGTDWQLLDTFVVNADGTALVGNTTGQTISADSQTLSYSGGALADADTVQLVLGAHFTASDEQIYVDNVEITETVLVDGSDGGSTTEVIASEDFDGLSYADQSNMVAWGGHWDIRNGELKTDGCNDGQIWFEEIQTNGETEISIDARAPHTEYFENGGYYGDSLDVWVLVDGTTWQHLDTFVVNEDGTALVGNETGQEITAEGGTLTWDGGLLADADSVQLYMYADISGGDEQIYFDNLTISDVVEDDAAGGEDILQNGSFESGVAAGHVDMNAHVDGWQSDTGIEGWGTGFEHQAASEGQSFIELDRNADANQLDNIYQDVQTEEGQTYTLNFDMAQRYEHESDSVEIYWNGELVSTASADGEDWQTFSVDVTGTGGTDRLEFRELASENDSTGPLLDNVSLVAEDNGSANCGQYEVTYDELMVNPLTEEEIAALLGDDTSAEEADEMMDV